MALSAAQFIVQRLREYDSSRAVPRNGGWYTLLVAPLSVIMQPLRDDIARIERSQSILQVLESAAPDDFDETVVDYLLSNIRVERKTGSKATTTMRVRFFGTNDFIAEAGSLTFKTNSGLKFSNTSAVNVTASQMNSQFDGEFFYVDVPVEAEIEGSDYNVDAAIVNVFENEPAGVADVGNISAITTGNNRETNRQFISRAKLAISVRTLVTGPGISSRITEDFAAIREVLPTGFGDDEMMRDIKSNVHVGGYVDAWMKPASVTTSVFDLPGVLQVDTTRERSAMEIIEFDDLGAVGDIDRPLHWSDLVSVSLLTGAGGSGGYVEGVDYDVDYVSGAVTRLSGAPEIAYIEGTNSDPVGSTAGAVLSDPSRNFIALGVKPGDRLIIDDAAYGGDAANVALNGRYTIASVATNSVTVVGSFPEDLSGFNVTPLGFAIYGRVRATYVYNPTTIDIIGTARAGRSAFTIDDVPLLRVSSVEDLDLATGEATGTFYDSYGGYGSGGYGAGGYGTGQAGDWILRVETPSDRFSAREDVYIEFNPAMKGYRVRVTYEHSPDVAAVHTYVTDPANRDVAADILAKHAVPAYFEGSIAYQVEASNNSTTEATMQKAVNEFLHGLGMGNGAELSDVVDAMYDAGAVKVTLPIAARLEVQNTDASVRTVTSQDVLSVPDTTFSDPSDKPLTSRISHIIPGAYVLTQTTAAA
jgi:uncharacterized phage protein gp47/JayE